LASALALTAAFFSAFTLAAFILLASAFALAVASFSACVAAILSSSS